jgi:hypothetical protein
MCTCYTIQLGVPKNAIAMFQNFTHDKFDSVATSEHRQFKIRVEF